MAAFSKRACDPAEGPSSRITLTEIAKVRLPDAVAACSGVIVRVLCNFTDEEAGLLVALPTRLIATRSGRERRNDARQANICEGELTGPSVGRLIESEP